MRVRGLKDRDARGGELKADGLHADGESGIATNAVQTTDAGGESGSEQAAPVESAPARAELDLVREERDQLMERMARLQAEFENTRRREVKERADLRDYAVQHAVEPFLSVMDNFQLALKSDGTLEQLRAGVDLILKQMEEALKGLQVQAVETVGKQFDPRVHEALGSIETKEFPDHQVLEEIRRGYRIREKLLRPALVRIASNHAVISE
ncbi:MAG TPA: nucleotide exchange factor GrpE [Acidobacteriaceae bacterium]|nr:nucleotide exchange factor GrpE [Acidobacteriaceae bacterium]